MSKELAQKFHEEYERLAVLFQYETRVETRTFDPKSRNGLLMIAVTDKIEKDWANRIGELEAENERLKQDRKSLIRNNERLFEMAQDTAKANRTLNDWMDELVRRHNLVLKAKTPWSNQSAKADLHVLFENIQRKREALSFAPDEAQEKLKKKIESQDEDIRRLEEAIQDLLHIGGYMHDTIKKEVHPYHGWLSTWRDEEARIQRMLAALRISRRTDE